jgi:hypothetical protein
MAYVTAQARQELLDAVGDVADTLGVALGAIGDAYEQLDDANADRVEADLFRPVQSAYGRIRRTHSQFAERYGLPARTFAPAPASAGSRGVKELLDRAVAAAGAADAELAALQDSMMPVEVGDAELRAGLSEVRRLIGHVGTDAQRFVRQFGR